MRRFRRLPTRNTTKRDPVTPELRDAVFARDGACVAWLLDRRHECRDKWGQPHSPRALGLLTIEHVKSELRFGKRAESDLAHTVLLCWGANVGVPSKEVRAAMRAYLEQVNAHTHVEPVHGCSECMAMAR